MGSKLLEDEDFGGQKKVRIVPDSRNLSIKFSDREKSTECVGKLKYVPEVPPPDSGWAWLVLLACFIIHVFLVSTPPLFSLLFPHKIKEFQMSTTTLAWIFNINAFCWNMSGTLAGPLTQEFGWRPVALISTLMASSSVIITSQATSVFSIYFTFSIMNGIGGGLAFSICHLCIPHYFKRRRGKAMTVMMFGASSGFLVLPFLFRFLQEWIGYNWTPIIYGGILFHTVVGAGLLHPVEWHNKPISILDDDGIKTIHGKFKQTSFDETAIEELDNLNDQEIINKSEEFTEVENKENETSSQKPANRAIVILKVFRSVLISTFKNFSNLRSARVLIIVTSGCFFVSGYLNYILMVPSTLAMHGFPMDKITYIMSLFGIFNAASRLIIPIFTDMRYFKNSHCFRAGILLSSISMVVSSFSKSPMWIMIAMASFGVGIGLAMGLFTLVIIDVMGLERLPSTFSLMCFVIASGFIITGPTVGAIRDFTDSFKVSNAILGGMVFFAFLIWFIMPFAKKYDKRVDYLDRRNQAFRLLASFPFNRPENCQM